MPIPVSQDIIEAVIERLEGINGNPLYLRGDKLRSVQHFYHGRRGREHIVNQRAEETILVRFTNVTGGHGETGNMLNTMQVQIVWIFFGLELDGADFHEALHDLNLALWTQGDRLDVACQRGRAYSCDVLTPDDEQTIDGLLYTFGVTYSEEIGNPTEKGT